MSEATRRAWAIVVVAALGYFVDIYDLLLFGIVRTASLKAIGVADADILHSSVLLLDAQMGGLLLGGFLWGVLGDRRGRVSVLFASIFLYSAANLANAAVGLPALGLDVDGHVRLYALLRFIAGVGLAGELGAGITLVAESLPKEQRGLGTTVVASVGIAGAVVAALVGDLTTWRVAYLIGGGLGVSLLLLRLGAFESGLFARAAEQGVSRGSLRMLFASKGRVRRLVCVVLVAVPIWYVVGILVTFAPEIGKALGVAPTAPVTARAIFWCYAGLIVGDLSSGLLSQALHSRKQVLGLYLVLTAIGVVLYFTMGRTSTTAFYGVCVFLGVATGYWAVFITTAAEQVGTNLRATVTTTAPNLVRGMVLPLTWMFRGLEPAAGVVGAALATGVVVWIAAIVALSLLDETYGRDLDFLET
jgi:putative MFS transporter